jgi:UPF0148 protein
MSLKEPSKIERISKMLELGGTMLSEHCDACGAPLFRYRGEVVCPVCREPETRGLEREDSVQETRVLQVDEVCDAIMKALSRKILDILSFMDAETDVEQIKGQLDCLYRALVVMREVQEFRSQR